MKDEVHIPVLLESVLDILGNISGKTVVDCTFGAGGYSRAFLALGARVIAYDRDPTVKKFADELHGKNFTFINKSFSEIDVAADAIVFDFGISSMQIDTPTRGFSWRFDAPLDMRMGDGISAAELIENISVEKLTEILRDYGDVSKAKIIAHAIKEKLPKTTFQLRDLIYNPNDVAPVFQAIRIAVNDELGEIERALAAVPNLLGPGGICACVTFHSLEDRLVKNTFRAWTTPAGDPRMPVVAAAPFELLKAVKPSKSELELNPRARSAHLRAVRKL